MPLRFFILTLNFTLSPTREKMKRILLIVGLLIASFTASYSQSETGKSGDNVTIVLFDNSEVKGEIVSDDDKEIVIRSETLGLLTFQKAEVKKIVYLYKKDGIFPNPMPARYVLGYSAFNIPKGGLYLYSFFGVGSQGLMYGITDNLSAEAGTSLRHLISGQLLYYGNLKYGFPIAKNLRGAASLTHLATFSQETTTTLYANITTLNALLTYGNKERNLTFGLGYNEATIDFSVAWIQGRGDFRGITYSLRGMTRLSKRFALITENWLLGEELLSSGGVRIMWRKTALNFLIGIDTKSEEFGLALIDFSIKL